MYPASKDEQFNPNGYDYRISILFRYTTEAMREFGVGKCNRHGHEKQYRDAVKKFQDHQVKPGTMKPQKPSESGARSAETRVCKSASVGDDLPTLMRAQAPRVGLEDSMATEEIDQGLWDLAVENVTKQQEEAFDALFDESVEEHLKGECQDCEDGLSSRCEDWLVASIEGWQENQFDYQAEGEYDRLVERQEEQEEESEEEARSNPT